MIRAQKFKNDIQKEITGAVGYVHGLLLSFDVDTVYARNTRSAIEPGDIAQWIALLRVAIVDLEKARTRLRAEHRAA